jgi:hypothetical protein
MNADKDELDQMLREAQRRQEIPWELTGPPEGLYEALATARKRSAEETSPDLQPIDISPFWPEGKKELCRRMNAGRKRLLALEEERNGR